MVSSISSKSVAAKQLASPFALSHDGQKTRRAAVAQKSIPVFGEELTTAASAQRTGKIAARQNPVSAKNLPVPRGTVLPKAKAQTLVAKSLTNKSLATASLVKPASTVKTAAAEDGGSVTTPPVDPAEAVRALLTELGYDASKFKFESREEYVSYPGGGYTHKYTAVELPNGLTENFTTDLMSRYPSVTANELRRLMENQHLTTQVTVQSFNGGT